MKTIFFFLLAITAFAQSPINQGGLKYERAYKVLTPAQPAVLDSLGNVVTPSVPETRTLVLTGQIVGIEREVEPDSTILIPHRRFLELTSWTTEVDMQQQFAIQINFYSPAGEPMTQVIDADTTLSNDAKNYRKRVFASQQIDRKLTRNSWIIPSTLTIVPAGTPGAVPELTFYQNVTDAQLVAMGVCAPGESRSLHRVYNMLDLSLLLVGRRIGIIR